jgi:hypothetical protein
MKRHDDLASHRTDPGWSAAITFLAVLLAFAALDDITTDRDTSFAFERLALAGCAGWFLFVARQLWQRGQRMLGLVSVGLVALAAILHPAIGTVLAPNPSSFLAPVAHLATVAAMAWFLLVAGMLAGAALFRSNHHPA